MFFFSEGISLHWRVIRIFIGLITIYFKGREIIKEIVIYLWQMSLSLISICNWLIKVRFNLNFQSVLFFFVFWNVLISINCTKWVHAFSMTRLPLKIFSLCFTRFFCLIEMVLSHSALLLWWLLPIFLRNKILLFLTFIVHSLIPTNYAWDRFLSIRCAACL